jgi:hypothetical protein
MKCRILGVPITASPVFDEEPPISLISANVSWRQSPGINRRKAGVPCDNYDADKAPVTGPLGALNKAHGFALCTYLCAARYRLLEDGELRILAFATLQPHAHHDVAMGSPDLHGARRFTGALVTHDPRMTLVDVLECDFAWRQICEIGLDIIPAAIPVLAGPMCLRGPCRRLSETLMGTPASTSWTDLARERLQACSSVLPAGFPLCSNLDRLRAVGAAGNAPEAAAFTLAVGNQ